MRALPLLIAALSALPAAAKGRRVAVLEYRAGVEYGPHLAERIASLLKKSSSLEVIDAQEARRRVGRVDNHLAQCSGENVCLARVGAMVDVDEVLVVAISKLGDVVVAISRVDVETRRGAGQFSEVLPPGKPPADEKLIRWLHALYPPDVFKRYGHIAVTANVAGAEIRLNGAPHGRTPLDEPIKVDAPGTYRVELAKRLHTPFDARIDVLPESTVEVRAELSPEGGALWYKRWYLWAIVGGVATAAAIGAAVYVSLPDTSQVTAILRRP